MQFPSEIKPILLGAAGGAAALAIIGFAWGGWVTATAAEKMVKDQSHAAVVSALAPICAEKFRQQPDALANITALKELSFYKQAALIKEGKWDVMVGSETSLTGTARACAELLTSLPQD